MSWITLDTKLGNHPKMAALPSDAARYGWVLTLLEAKEQRTPGTFASEKHYRHVMPRHGRFLADYVKAGLIDKGDDGTLHVHDWQRHQWASAKAAQRETSNGQVEDIPKTSLGQQQDASRAVPVHVSVSSSTEGGAGGNLEYDDDERRVFLAMARAGAHIRPESGMGQRVLRLIGRRGADAILAELARLSKSGPLSDRQIVFGIEDALDKIPDTRTDEAIRERETRAQRIQEQAAARRIDYFSKTGVWDSNFGPEPKWRPEWGQRPKVAA